MSHPVLISAKWMSSLFIVEKCHLLGARMNGKEEKKEEYYKGKEVKGKTEKKKEVL